MLCGNPNCQIKDLKIWNIHTKYLQSVPFNLVSDCASWNRVKPLNALQHNGVQLDELLHFEPLATYCKPELGNSSGELADSFRQGAILTWNSSLQNKTPLTSWHPPIKKNPSRAATNSEVCVFLCIRYTDTFQLCCLFSHTVPPPVSVSSLKQRRNFAEWQVLVDLAQRKKLCDFRGIRYRLLCELTHTSYYFF